MRCLAIALTFGVFLLSSTAYSDTYIYCKGDECVGHQTDSPSPTRIGTYQNPVVDRFGGDTSVPLHRGMYCVRGIWHYGFLRPWEQSPVVKASCGSAAYQIPD